MTTTSIIRFINADIYQRDNLVLTDVNLEINEGEFVYVIGKVGSGKTSLIKTINAEIPLFSGEAEVAGYKLHKLKTKDVPFLRRKMGVVFQDFRLLTDRNVFNNLEFVLKATGWKQEKAIKDRVKEVLEKAGVGVLMKKMPHELSGGEQQRVVIARAILNEPEIILADEPTGHLDPETSEEIFNLLVDLNKAGKTILMASHDYSLISQFKKRTLVCEKQSLNDTSVEDGEVDFDALVENGN